MTVKYFTDPLMETVVSIIVVYNGGLLSFPRTTQHVVKSNQESNPQPRGSDICSTNRGSATLKLEGFIFIHHQVF